MPGSIYLPDFALPVSFLQKAIESNSYGSNPVEKNSRGTTIILVVVENTLTNLR